MSVPAVQDKEHKRVDDQQDSDDGIGKLNSRHVNYSIQSFVHKISKCLWLFRSLSCGDV